jgi:hypothetical protein
MTDFVGSYAIQADHPGLMKSIKKRKISKQDRSVFVNDEDAKKQYIEGEVDTSGKIVDRINKRLEE